jgi:hypothetical protein
MPASSLRCLQGEHCLPGNQERPLGVAFCRGPPRINLARVNQKLDAFLSDTSAIFPLVGKRPTFIAGLSSLWN